LCGLEKTRLKRREEKRREEKRREERIFEGARAGATKNARE
jgi:hypothetical protein